MEGIFGSILYLIPIALFIAIRVINAKNKTNKKPPQRPEGRPVPEEDLGELIRQIKENKKQPAHWEVNTEARTIPSAVPRATVPKKPVGIKKKKPVIKQTVEPSQFMSDNTSLSGIKTQTETSDQKTLTAKQRTSPISETGILLQGLSPLQQAVVWAEILGQPKSLGDIS